MKLPPKNVQRAYAITSFILASLKDAQYESIELKKIHIQCARAMRVFSAKVPPVWFDDFIDKVGNIWEEVGTLHDAKIEKDNAGLLVEAFGYILTPKEFKSFLGVSPYVNKDNHSLEDFKKSLAIALDINSELNILLETKSTVWQKPKEKKVKQKKPKEKSKKQKKHEVEVLKRQESKKRKQDFFAEIRKKAEQKKKMDAAEENIEKQQ